MKKTYLSFLIASFLFSCQGESTEKTNDKSSDEPQEEVEKDSLVDEPETMEAENSLPDSDCVRAQAGPVVKKEIYPNAVFTLNKDNLTANESFELKNGDKINIHNHGCEYYVLTFTIETNRYSEKQEDHLFWYKATADLMEEISPGLNASVDLPSGIAALREYAESGNEGTDLNFGENIFYGESEISFSVILDEIQNLKNGKKSIEVSFMVGPL